MTEAEAHVFFFRKHGQNDREFFPHTVELSTPPEPGSTDSEVWQDIWPSGCVAAVSMVGWLDDCKTDEDLLEAVAHFQTCVSSGIGGFTLDDWKQESYEVAIRQMEQMLSEQGVA